MRFHDFFQSPLLSLRDTLGTVDLKPYKSLGQHFLLDPALLRRIAAAADQGCSLTGATVIEIGPGPGGLTRALLEHHPHRLITVEKDPRSQEALTPLRALALSKGALSAEDMLSAGFVLPSPVRSGPTNIQPMDIQVITHDACTLDLHTLGGPDKPRQLVANLPYNVSTPLLGKCFSQPHAWDQITVLVQKEVALRLAATPGNKAYGRLAVGAQRGFHVRMLFDVAAGSFVPPPQVTSTVVQLRPRQTIVAPDVPWSLWDEMTRALFAHRRKVVRTTLKPLVGECVSSVNEVLSQAGICPTARAETLSLEDLARLALCLFRRVSAR